MASREFNVQRSTFNESVATKVPTRKHARARPRAVGRPVKTLALGMVVIVAALAFLAYQGLSNNLVYYITPSELLAKGAAVNGEHLRLGGQVRPGTIRWNPHTRVLRFVLQDPHHAVRVISYGLLPPELFRSGMGAVVEGTYAHGAFTATNLMIKHSSDYVAPAPGRLPKSDNYAHK